MEIEYHLTETDILVLMRYRISKVPKRRNPIVVRRFAFLVGFLLISLGSYLDTKNVVLPLIFLAIGIIVCLIYPIYFDHLLRRRVSETYKDEKKRATLGKRILRVTDEGIEEISELRETKVRWEAIYNITVMPAYTIISIQSDPSLIIPENRVSSGDYNSFIYECRRFLLRRL